MLIGNTLLLGKITRRITFNSLKTLDIVSIKCIIMVHFQYQNVKMRTKTTESYRKELSLKNPTIKQLGEYVGTGKRSLHRCMVCQT